MADYRFSAECFDCPFCGKTITPPHVKRHLTTHNDLSDDEVGIAWIRWLEARDEISAENADRMVAVAEKRRVEVLRALAGMVAGGLGRSAP